MTFFYKWVFSTVFVGAVALVTIAMAITSHRSAPVLLLVTLGGGAVVWLVCGRLKSVHLDGHELVVSNYFSVVRVPLRAVSSVGCTVLLSPELIWLRLHEDTAFGRQVIFMPPLRLLGGFTIHPLVDELRTLARVR